MARTADRESARAVEHSDRRWLAWGLEAKGWWGREVMVSEKKGRISEGSRGLVTLGEWAKAVNKVTSARSRQCSGYR